MEIRLNNLIKQIEPERSLQNLLSNLLPQNVKGIAVAVNNTVIPKSDWSHFIIQSNDDILIINATQGG